VLGDVMMRKSATPPLPGVHCLLSRLISMGQYSRDNYETELEWKTLIALATPLSQQKLLHKLHERTSSWQ